MAGLTILLTILKRNSTFGDGLMSDAAESSAEESEVSDRYELSDLFSDENEDTQDALKVVGVLILFGLMAYALSLPFTAYLN
jgi:hypothetical protein